MSLWKTTDTDTDAGKPKNLTDAEKKNVFATTAGWVRKAGVSESGNDNANADPEVLVAIRDLSTATRLAEGTISSVSWRSSSYAQGDSASVWVYYNEKVTVVGNPTMAITWTGVSGNQTATYDDGSGSNKLQFTFTVPSEAGTASVGAQSIALAGGTIRDTGTNSDSDVTIPASYGTAAGTRVVT